MQTLESLTMDVLTEQQATKLPKIDPEGKATPKPRETADGEDTKVVEVKTNSTATKEELSKKTPTPEKEVKENAMPTLTFDNIYNKIIKEENFTEPEADVESTEFDPDAGDFGGESEDPLEGDETVEEIDEDDPIMKIDTLISQLEDLKLALGGGTTEEEVGDEFSEETGDEFGGLEDEEPLKMESAKAGCAYGKLKPNANKGESLKKGQNTPGKLASAKKGKAPLPAQKGDKTGKIQQMSRPASKEVAKSAGTVKGNSPATKGRGADFIQ
jgi:hypothetical protein